MTDEPRVLRRWVEDSHKYRLLEDGDVERLVAGDTWNFSNEMPEFASICLELERHTKELEEAKAEIERLHEMLKDHTGSYAEAGLAYSVEVDELSSRYDELARRVKCMPTQLPGGLCQACLFLLWTREHSADCPIAMIEGEG